jgi:hypothetical protein
VGPFYEGVLGRSWPTERLEELGDPPSRASGSCVAGPREPLALRRGASCPSQRSVPPPCRPGVAKQARLGRQISPGGSLRVAWVVRVSSQVAHNVTRSPPDQTHTHPSAGKRSSAKYTRSPPTLAAYSQTHPPYWIFSGLGDCPNNLIRSFPSSEKLPTPVYTDTEAALFTEVRGSGILRTSALRSSEKLVSRRSSHLRHVSPLTWLL